jgi:TPP-dependent pyruvate/acetoin dehydrogenase alpha subunit
VAWRARDPVVRFRHWLVSNGWWDEAQEKQLRHATRQQVGVLYNRLHCRCWQHCPYVRTAMLSVSHRCGVTHRQVVRRVCSMRSR